MILKQKRTDLVIVEVKTKSKLKVAKDDVQTNKRRSGLNARWVIHRSREVSNQKLSELTLTTQSRRKKVEDGEVQVRFKSISRSHDAVSEILTANS